jgi:hypothetical protein
MFILITGQLWRDPVTRTGKNDTTFVTATMRYRAGNQETGWVSLIAFQDLAQAELMRL